MTPEFLEALVDDAAIFPPGNAPLPRAVAEHLGHLGAPYADLVGGFVVSDLLLPELTDLTQTAAEPIAVNLVVTGGAGAIEGAVRWASRAGGVDLVALEFALRDEDDLAHNARRVLAAVDDIAAELGDAEVYVEPPRIPRGPSAGWLDALDELAAREVRLKFRTGGVTPDAVPSSTELAACIDAALDRELAFKCTAGLHHAVRHTDPETGLVRHGFLNVLRATRAALDGDDVVAALEESDPARVLEGVDQDALARTRRWFTAFGSCSVLEPHEDLVELGLL